MSFVGFRIALDDLKTFTIVSRLFVNDVTSDTVCILFGFNMAFFPDRSQKVMRLYCWHQPLHHLEEEC